MFRLRCSYPNFGESNLVDSVHLYIYGMYIWVAHFYTKKIKLYILYYNPQFVHLHLQMLL